MKTRNLLLALGCAAAFTACTVNDEPAVAPAPAMRTVTLSVDVNEPADTRVAYSETETAYQFNWSGDETLRVFYDDGEEKYADFTIKSFEGKKATFTSTDFPAEFTGNVAIVYAGKEFEYKDIDENGLNNGLLLSGYFGQTTDVAADLADRTLLYAQTEVTEAGKLPNVKLNHMFSYLLLKAGLQVTQEDLSVGEGDTELLFNFCLPSKVSFSSTEFKSVIDQGPMFGDIYVTGGRLVNDCLIPVLIVPESETISLLMVGFFSGFSGTPNITEQPSFTYEPGVVYEVKAGNTKWLPMTVEIPEANPIDLSANESANCYLVPKAGTYKFKATVKGNGSADLAGISKDTDPETIDKAELIWATFNTATAPEENELLKDIKYEDGYVYFSTGSTYKEGNALIAIKDASGTILWSWHLWFESDDLAALAQTYPNLDYKMMDRNLGALTNCYAADNALDFGFAYQNGRKDPFMMSASRTSFEKLGVLGTYTTDAGTSNVATSIKNPTVVYGTDSWGGLPEYWGSNTEKTIFDPCPPGWRVAPSGVWSAAGFSTTTFVPKDNDFNTYHGWVFNDIAWFPATGDRWGSNHNNTGKNIRVWAKTHGSDLACDNTTLYDVSGGGSNPGHGYSVRPMKE